MYNRSKSSDASVLKTRVVETWSHTGQYSAVSTPNMLHVYDTLTTSGVDIPDYHKRKKRGELLPLTAFEQIKVQGQHDFAYDLRYLSTQYRQKTAWTPLSNIEPPTQASADLKLYDTSYYVQAAAAKIYSNSADALTFLAELRKTMDMFRNLLNNLAHIVKNGLPEKRPQFGSSWMETRYGWRVLVKEIQDINKAIKRLDEERTRFKERSGTNIKEKEILLTSYGFGGAGAAQLRITDSYTIGLRGTVVADAHIPAFVFNPVVTAWELTKLSFVADWVINVGQALEAISLVAIALQLEAAGGHLIQIDRSVEVVSVAPAAGWSLSLTGNANYTRLLTKRTPTSVSFKPFVKIRLDTAKLTDMAAMIGSKLRR